MKKIISVILALVMILTIAVPAFAVNYKNTSDIPIIYLYGKQADIISADGQVVFPLNMPDDYIMNAVKDCLPYLMDSLKTNEWTEYREKLLSYVEPLFTDVRLDGNGDISNGTHTDFSWDSAGLTQQVKSKNGNYKFDDFTYRMDWRLDPFDVAEDLHAYIQTIKAAAGVDKVNVVSRCEGCNLLVAYYVKYGYEDFNCVEFYVSGLGGLDTIGAAFGGSLEFEADSLTRFVEGYEENLKNGIGNDVLTEFIYDTLYLLKETYTIDVICLLIQPLASKLYTELLAPSVLASFGTLPGIWTLVPCEDYENAKENVFKGVEDEYAGLIAKLDRYQNEVNSKYFDILKEAEAAGVKTAVYAKYGEYSVIPISKSNKEVTDGMVTLTRTSLGATTPAYDKLLDEKYLANAESNGTAKYISPDKKVDASTALFPDKTWFIFNNYHDSFPDSIHNNLMMKFFMADGELTVFDDPQIPQYMFCGADTGISPLTAENGFKTVVRDSSIEGIKKSVKERALEFVNTLLKLIKQFISKLFKGEISF